METAFYLISFAFAVKAGINLTEQSKELSRKKGQHASMELQSSKT
jgi:hypothetical protein